MKTLCIIVLLIGVLAIPAAAQFELPKIELQAAYLHSLETGENQGAMIASVQVGSVKGIPVDLDIMFAPDFDLSGGWGLGASAVLGKASKLKLGIGGVGGMTAPVAYISYRLN